MRKETIWVSSPEYTLTSTPSELNQTDVVLKNNNGTVIAKTSLNNKPNMKPEILTWALNTINELMDELIVARKYIHAEQEPDVKTPPYQSNGEHLIWSDDDIVSDENIKAFKESTLDEPIDFTEAQMCARLYEQNAEWLEDEKELLKTETKEPFTLVIMGELHTWQGIRHRTVIFENSDLSRIFNITFHDTNVFYGKNNEIYCRTSHHDGTNIIRFRKMKDPSQESIDKLNELLSSNKLDDTAKNKAIIAATDSLYPDIAAIYGWTDPEPEDRT